MLSHTRFCKRSINYTRWWSIMQACAAHWFTTCIQVIQQNWQDSVDSGHLSAGHLIDCVVTILYLAKTVCQLTSLVEQTDLQSLCLYGLISLLVYIVIHLYLIESSSYCTYHSYFSCYKSSQTEQLRAAIQGSSIPMFFQIIWVLVMLMHEPWEVACAVVNAGFTLAVYLGGLLSYLTILYISNLISDGSDESDISPVQRYVNIKCT